MDPDWYRIMQLACAVMFRPCWFAIFPGWKWSSKQTFTWLVGRLFLVANLTILKTAIVTTTQCIPEYFDLMNHFNDELWSTWWTTYWMELQNRERAAAMLHPAATTCWHQKVLDRPPIIPPFAMADALTGAGTAMFDDAMMAKTLCWEVQSVFVDWLTITRVDMSTYNRTCIYKLRIVDIISAETV